MAFKQFLAKVCPYSMWRNGKRSLFLILLMLAISVLAFFLGYSGIGSNIIIVNDDNQIDCFFKDNPYGLNLYTDCRLMKQALNSNVSEALPSNEYKLAYILKYHSNIIQNISNDYKLTNPEIEELQKEISRCLLAYEKTKDKSQNQSRASSSGE